MNKHEIKREIRSYYCLQNGRIRLNLEEGTFIIVIGDCLSAEVKLPPNILRTINLNKLIKD